MILHTINKRGALEKCRDFIAEADLVVLLEDGIYLGGQVQGDCYLLEADVMARGWREHLPAGARLIDYGRFVQLTVAADKVCNWF